MVIIADLVTLATDRATPPKPSKSRKGAGTWLHVAKAGGLARKAARVARAGGQCWPGAVARATGATPATEMLIARDLRVRESMPGNAHTWECDIIGDGASHFENYDMVSCLAHSAPLEHRISTSITWGSRRT